MNIVNNQKGIGVMKVIVYTPLVLLLFLAATFGFYEARKAYWDHRVREMCDKDGGVFVYDKVEVSRGLIGAFDKKYPVALREEIANVENYPYFYQSSSLVIHKSSPTVVKGERVIIRRVDGKVMGKSVQYWRRGGDFPTGLAHTSSFVCPPHALLSEEVFEIAETYDDQESIR